MRLVTNPTLACFVEEKWRDEQDEKQLGIEGDIDLLLGEQAYGNAKRYLDKREGKAGDYLVENRRSEDSGKKQ